MSRPYFFSFFLPNASSTPPPQSALFFFFIFFFLSSWGREKMRGGEERTGGGFGFGVRKQMKAAFFFPQRYRGKLHAMPHTATLCAWKSTSFTAATSCCRKKNTHMLSVYYFLTFRSLHHTMSSLLSPLSASPHSHVWQSESRPGRDKMRPFTPLDWQCLGLFLSAHWSYHYFNLTKYECALSHLWCYKKKKVCVCVSILAVRTTQRQRHEHAEIHRT